MRRRRPRRATGGARPGCLGRCRSRAGRHRAPFGHHRGGNVAANLLRYWGPGSTLVSHPVGGQPALLGFHGRALAALLVLRMRGGQVEAVHVIADPAQIGFLSRRLATSAR
jgi:RNA polymerase sigma-70 factor (ECF subfamily)